MLQTKQAGAAFWDANPCGGDWETYQDFYDWIQRTEPYIFEILQQYDVSGKLICDVGCGQGSKTNFLAELGAQVVGIDMSMTSIQRTLRGTQELGTSVEGVSLADAETIPFESESFDLALSSGVLHHTPNTQKGIDEIHRILKPKGKAIVMLYRTGNPKWWAASALRASKARAERLNAVREKEAQNDARGTALHELFGVPIMKAYSNQEAYQMFDAFEEVSITNHQPGFRRMVDIVPLLRPFDGLLARFDAFVKPAWGFYQVIEATK